MIKKMVKIQNPLETGNCEKCKYFAGNNFCNLHVEDPERDKPVSCKRVKVCFSFKERELSKNE